MTRWPALPYAEWKDTRDTLHMQLQVVGKVRLALSPLEPQWANVPLYLTGRGLTTSTIPHPSGEVFDLDVDLVDHSATVRTGAGGVERVPLQAPVAAFYADLMGAMDRAGVPTEISTLPSEVPDPIPFPDDTTHAAYDPSAAMQFWRVLAAIDPVFSAFRAAFKGKVSRVQFFWGHVDLNVTRFSGAPCTPPVGADILTRASYDYEQVSAGWWPGDAKFRKPAFYAYGYPKPEGIESTDLGVAGAAWDADLGEFVLDYEIARTAPSPEASVRAFLDAAYDACAARAHWDPRLAS